MSRCPDKATEFFPRSPLSRLSSLCLNLQLIYVVSMLWIGEAAAGKPLDVDDAKVVKSNIDRGEACIIRNMCVANSTVLHRSLIWRCVSI